jgi:hypothetical protein
MTGGHVQILVASEGMILPERLIPSWAAAMQDPGSRTRAPATPHGVRPKIRLPRQMLERGCRGRQHYRLLGASGSSPNLSSANLLRRGCMVSDDRT